MTLRILSVAACSASCFTFSSLSTPIVTEYEVRDHTDRGLRLVITGEKFDLAADISDIEVLLDGYLQTIEDYNSTQIVAQVVKTQSPNIAILQLSISPHGKAFIPLLFDDNALPLPRGLVYIPLQISSVQGNILSAEYGSQIYIHGIYIYIYMYVK